VLTIFLALGAWRISQNHVLTRRMPAIETLGAATVLCVDKTGTLTLNQMSVRQLYANNEIFDVSVAGQTRLAETFHELLEFGILASKKDPFDPMEKALRQIGDKYLAHTEHLHDNWSLEHEYPLSPAQLALSHVWRLPGQDGRVVAAKGAPEAIADLCHLDSKQTKLLLDRVGVMAGEGLRVRCSKGYLPPIEIAFQPA
jgi:Ca2+-transporting ATPase